MNSLIAIVWDVSPFIFQGSGLSIRYYSILFVLGFIIGYFLLQSFFKDAGKSSQEVDLLVVLTFFLVIIGGRLGHVLFYDPAYYFSNPEKILKIHEGGLASHGAIFLTLLVLPIYCRVRKLNFLWLIDRMVIPVSLGAALVRLGNLMNSEIYGTETSLPWGFIFIRTGETLPKHPTQIYEALAYIAVFVYLIILYRKYRRQLPNGLITGWFLLLLWSARFTIEFLKEPQSIFDISLPLNMGQILSIPLILAGAYMILRIQKKTRTL